MRPQKAWQDEHDDIKLGKKEKYNSQLYNMEQDIKSQKESLSRWNKTSLGLPRQNKITIRQDGTRQHDWQDGIAQQ